MTAVVTEITKQASEPVIITDSDTTEASGNTTETTSLDITEETSAVDASEDSTGEAEENVPTDNPETVPAETEPPAPARIYQDGTFTAAAYGYDGNITVHVTIQNDTITDITAETEESDDSYFFDAKSAVIPAIIRSQAADVDVCSGATYSSNGIMAAVRTALEQARI